MKLLEYQVDKFIKDCVYDTSKRHECAGKGFLLANWINQGVEFWLNSKDCTDEDFIKEAYIKIIGNDIIPESELLEIMARFLCGYDKYEDFKKEILQIPKEKRGEFFSKRKDAINSYISDKEHTEKIKFIKKCINNV